MTNLFNKFQALVGSSITELVNITANNGNGTSSATTLSGVSIVVRGESVNAGNRAIVQSGSVMGPGPSGAITELQI
jgi:hypothetical protein